MSVELALEFCTFIIQMGLCVHVCCQVHTSEWYIVSCISSDPRTHIIILVNEWYRHASEIRPPMSRHLLRPSRF